MNVYHFRPHTGLFLGVGQADPDPQEPGNWLYPAHSTLIQPPDPAEGYEVIWDGDNWVHSPIPEPEPAPEPPPPTPEQIQQEKVNVVQRHLDLTAKVFGYDNIFSAVTYAEEPSVPRFQAEGLAFRRWRSLVWAACYDLLAEVQAGHQPIPSDTALIAVLPKFQAPLL